MKRLILLIFCLSSIVSWGQSIKGKVIDAKSKEAIPGANITVPGVKGVGTSTDFDGTFTFTLPAGKTQISVSTVGYKAKNVNVAPGANITVSLEEDAAVLDDVVIVGYGTQKKESLTGAVATVDVAKTLDSRPIPDVARALQGSTPGLTVRISNGELGSDPTIRIRGSLSSLQGSSAPLILVDNVEIPSLLFVNPDDVESISVLKDAASSSIYGAKAANGVVLIQTKQGSKKDGKVTVNYSGSYTLKTPTKNVDLAGYDNYEFAMDYLESRQDVSKYGEVPVSAGAFWMMNSWLKDRAQYWDQNWKGKVENGSDMIYGRDWETIGVNGGSAYNYGYRQYDGYDALVKDWTPQHQHNINIAGTAGKTSFNLGLGYLNQTGVLKNTQDTYQRYNASLSINTEVNKWLTLKANFMFSKSDKDYPNVSYSADPYYYAYRWSTFFPIGATYNGGLLNDPSSEVKQANIATRTKEYTRFMVGGRLTFLKGWTADFDLTYAGDKNYYYEPGQRFDGYYVWNTATKVITDTDGNQIWRDKDGQIVAAGTEGASGEVGWDSETYTAKGSGFDQVYYSSGRSERITWNANTTYDAKFGDHAIKVMVGMNTNSYRYTYHSSTKAELSNEDMPEISLADGKMEVSGSKTWQSQAGFFGRINYAWKDKLLFEVNGRYEGTSKFPTNLRWKFFPSGSIGYRISEENWFEPIKSVVSEAKIRASYGSLGNQSVGSAMYIPTLTKYTGSTIYNWGQYDGVFQGSYSSPSLVRDDVTWETITTFDIGLDMRFWKNKVGVSFDWYSKTTTDLFVPGASMPSTFGGTAPQGNFGKLRTTGWELSVDFNHRFSNGINFSANFGISDNTAKMLNYTESTIKTIGSWYNGREYGEIWGYVFDRLYQSTDFEEYVPLNGVQVSTIDAAYVEWYYGKAYKLKDGFDGTGALHGGAKYKDLNGDGVVNGGQGTVDDPGDRVKIGTSLPRYEYSFRFNADWKGIDLGLFFQGVGQRYQEGGGPLSVPVCEIGQGQISSNIANTWSEDNPNAFFPRTNAIGRESGWGGSYLCSKHYLLDMAYLRLKTVTLGYTIPRNITEKAGISKLRVYFTGENLLTFSNLRFPIDPEMQTGSMLSSSYNAGQVGTTTPISKTLSFGLQIGL
ncbi:MAG: TonB-dependent receptor [Flavobacteriales bacterium]|nr:TonB-dependent receptor [Flavobacteriales bacterium]